MRADTFQRVTSDSIAVAAFVWSGWVVYQALQADDGGPPAGAICAAAPAFMLILGAGALWPKRK